MTALDEALWPRAALPRRPMLGAVLDALTVTGGLPSSDWLQLRAAVLTLSAEGARIVVPRLDGRGRRADYDMRYAWTTTDPAEAYELLQARGLVPMEYRPRFTCEACAARPGVDCIGYFDCHGTGTLPHPPTVAALASWASLGFAAGDDGAPGILGAEEWAQQLAAQPEVAWRVAPPSPADATTRMPDHPLAQAGLGFAWDARIPRRITLVVPPLGLVTP